MRLETLRPNPVWNADAYEDAVSVFEALADDITVKVWCGDWCPDCRSQLPDFGAALEAAGVEDVEEYPVEKDADGSKVGPKVETYGVERIPTVVVEWRSPEGPADPGEELARFVEEADRPMVVELADQLEEYAA